MSSKIDFKVKLIKPETEINKIETKRKIQTINETKSWFFEKNNKIDKPLSKPTKGQIENSQINYQETKWEYNNINQGNPKNY